MLNELGIAYLHIAETKDPSFTPILRQMWKGVFMLNPATPGGDTGPEHLALPDMTKAYGDNAHGYTDYPTMNEQEQEHEQEHEPDLALADAHN